MYVGLVANKDSAGSPKIVSPNLTHHYHQPDTAKGRLRNPKNSWLTEKKNRQRDFNSNRRLWRPRQSMLCRTGLQSACWYRILQQREERRMPQRAVCLQRWQPGMFSFPSAIKEKKLGLLIHIRGGLAPEVISNAVSRRTAGTLQIVPITTLARRHHPLAARHRTLAVRHRTLAARRRHRPPAALLQPKEDRCREAP